jgi:hypothetical protein
MRILHALLPAALVALAWTLASADESNGLKAFEAVRSVLQHPRCQNCHPFGDAPLQRDDGRVHGQNVRRGPEGKGAIGLSCSTCHMASNPPASYGPNQPPGAPHWMLPPPKTKMVFQGLTPAQLAKQLKDPAATGGRDLEALLDHVTHDPLVLWGWNPGVGREPPPIPHAEFVARFREWVAAGAPVPGE